MQPAQLSLLADQIPTPAPMLLAELPARAVAEALTLMGGLIAKASMNDPTEGMAEEGGDE